MPRRKDGRAPIKAKETFAQTTMPPARKAVRAGKRANRRNEIMIEAARLFAKKSYHSVTVDEVAGGVGIAKGTIYLYFKSKENLYLSILEQAFEELEDRMSEEIEKGAPSPAKLSEVLKVVFSYFRTNVDVLRILTRDETHLIREHFELTEQWKNRGVALYKKVLDRGVGEGSFKPMNTTLTALIIYGLVRSVTFHYETTKSPEKVAEEVFEVIAHGVLTS